MTTNDISKQGNTKTPINLNTISQLYNRRKNPYDELATKALVEGWTVDAKEAAKYNKAGLNYNPNILPKLDKALAESQGAFTKIGNSAAQTLVSEIGIGIPKAISDLFDGLGYAIGLNDGDYSNPVSAFLEQKQEEFREYAPIHVTPGVNISNGGLADIGWWASNFPSVASSLTLLVPGAGVVKGLSMIGKAVKIGARTRKALRGMTFANKRINEGRKLSTFQKWANAPSTAKSASLLFENGATAAMMRLTENYQEARQTYNNMYETAFDNLTHMSDAEYSEFKEANKQLLKENGIDSDDKNEVAKFIATQAADVTFKTDWLNLGWDILQLYALKNAWKGIKNAPSTSSSVRRAQKDMLKYGMKSKQEIAALKAKRTFKEKVGEKLEDIAYGSKLAITAQLSEGAEEALNYIAQEEGISYGKALLDTDSSNNSYSVWNNVINGWDNRLKSYLTSPELYDAAFWGVMGGILFQGAANKFKQVQSKIDDAIESKKEGKKEAKSAAEKKLPWWKLDELAENKRRIKEIEDRAISYQQHKAKLEQIGKGIDPYNSTEENEVKFATEAEREAAREYTKKLWIANMARKAANAGNIDLLKEMVVNPEIHKQMIADGIFGNPEQKTQQELEQEAEQFSKDALNTIQEVEDLYITELNRVLEAATSLKKGYNVPAEYLQIIANDNVDNLLAIDYFTQAKQRINNRISELEDDLKDKLDPNVPYKNTIRLGIIANELGYLRAERKRLVEDGENSLTNQLAIRNIDDKIQRLENYEELLEQENLIYTTFQSLRYTSTPEGVILENTPESFIYRDAMIEQQGLDDGIINDFPSLAPLNLSEKARTSIGEGAKERYKIIEQNTEKVFKKQEDGLTELERISKELNDLYKRQIHNEIAIDFSNDMLYKTTDEISEQISTLHNSFNEARKNAINQATKTIGDLYKKVKDNRSIFRTYINAYINETNPNDISSILSEAEINQLNKALDVLALDKGYNQGLLYAIENKFHLIEAFEKAKEEHEKTLDSDKETSDNETPEISNSNTKTTFIYDNEEVSAYDQGNGLYAIDVEGDIKKLNDPNLFENTAEVDLTKPYVIQAMPIVAENEEGQLEIKEKGRLKNVESSEEQGEETPEAISVEEKTPIPPVEPPTSNYKDNINEEIDSLINDIIETENNYNPSTLEKLKEVKDELVKDLSSIDPNTVNLDEVIGDVFKKHDIKNVWDNFNVIKNALGVTKDDVYDIIKANKPNQTNPSTGEVVSKTEKVKESAPIIHQVSNIDIYELELEILQELILPIRKNPNVDIEDLCLVLLNTYVNNGYDKTIIEQLINKKKPMAERIAKTFFTKEEEKEKESTMQSSIDEVIKKLSSITEKRNSKTVKEFKQAIEYLVKQYIKDAKIHKNGNKYYINYEDLLAYINSSTTDKSIAKILYGTITEYLKTSEFKNKYILMDEEYIDNANFIENVYKERRQRYNESLEDITMQRVDLSTILDSLSSQEELDKFYDALDSLQVGDKLTYKEQDGKLHIVTSNGVTVGTMTIPSVNTITGAYELQTEGWLVDIDKRNNRIVSKLRDKFVTLFTSDIQDAKDIRKLLYELAYENPNKTRKNQIYAIIENTNLFKQLTKDSTEKLATTEQLTNHLVKLLKFTNQVEVKLSNNNILEAYIDMWFTKLYNSYNVVYHLSHSNASIEVGKISDGEIIRIKDKATKSDIPELLPVSKAIAGGINTAIHKIAIAQYGSTGELLVSGNSKEIFKQASLGNTFVIIPNRSKRNAYVQAFPVSITDDKLSKEAKDIIKDIKTTLKDLIKNHYGNASRNDDTFSDLRDFLNSLLSNKDQYASLFKGIAISEKNGNITLSIFNGPAITFFKNNKRNGIQTSTFSSQIGFAGFSSSNLFTDGKGTTGYSESTWNAIDEFLNNLEFQISMNHIHGDNNTTKQFKGLATRNSEGKFVITIGNNTYTYESYNDFILNNDIVRLNTKPDKKGKSNFNRKGIRSQGANQVFDIKISSSSPVEGLSNNKEAIATPEAPVVKSISEQIVAVFSQTSSHVGNSLLDVLYDAKNAKEQQLLKKFKDLNLLPENIIFDKNFNNKEGYVDVNAEVNIDDNTVTVGTKWISMATNPYTKMEAIRKLIHEQLHIKLHENENRGFITRAESIYNEFKEALNDKHWVAELTKLDFDVEHLKEYLFLKEPTEVAIEEFFVESLTSEELAKALNAIDAKVDNRSRARNLFQKILEFMSKVFEWGVRKNSLYEKELRVIADVVGNNKTIEEKQNLEKTLPILTSIIEEGKKQELTENEVYYKDKETGVLSVRVTSAIEAVLENVKNGKVKRFDKNSPWIVPSTNIGTGVDEFVRDFFLEKLDNLTEEQLEENYPNASGEQLNQFREQLIKFKKDLLTGKIYEGKRITIISRDIKATGEVDVKMPDGSIKKLPVTGTLDLLGYDQDGKFYIFDMKTIHDPNYKQDIDKNNKWNRQLYLYKKFLETKFGISVEGCAIIPIRVDYKAPEGSTNAKGEPILDTSKYEVKNPNISKDYDNPNRTQLLENGEVFKNANPRLEEENDNLVILKKNPKPISIEYQYLDDNAKALLDEPIIDDSSNTNIETPSETISREERRARRKARKSSVTENNNDYSNTYTPEMQEIKAKAIANGTFMKAPNGKPTNLNERQWLQVRTKNFINWFGDWINDKEHASKVVDENEEPLVVYHGTRTGDAIRNEGFSSKMSGKGNRGANNKQFYFTSSYENAEYTGVKAKEIEPLIDIITSVYDLFGTSDIPSVKDIYNIVKYNEQKVRELKDNLDKVRDDSPIKKLTNKLFKLFSINKKDADEIRNEYRKTIDSVEKDINELYKKAKVVDFFNKGLEYLSGDKTKTSVNTLNFIKESINSESPYRQKAANKLINILYGTDNLVYSPEVFSVFLNIRTPLTSNFNMKPSDENPLLFSGFSTKLIDYNTKEQKLLEELNDSKYDGSISKNKFDILFSDIYIVKNPNQIKSATSNTEFGTTDNIYHSSVTERTPNIAISNTASVNSFISQLPLSQQANFVTLVRYGEVSTSCR